jgi:hypothetical protein
MPRRRRGRQNIQNQQYGRINPQFGPSQGYENAAEPVHNGNFAWNGQLIPDNQMLGQASQSGGSGYDYPSSGPNLGGPPFMAQARDYGSQTFQGGVPIPGSSGNVNANYGERNTGINHADARHVGFQGGYTGYGPNGQPIQYGTFMRDGTQYGQGPHTIDPNKAVIRAVHYEGGGISAVQFQDGSVVDIASAIAMSESGLIEDSNTGRNREGQKTLRSYPDGDPSNNLSNLPRF